MNYSYYDGPVEKVLNMLGYKDEPQDVYVTLESLSPFYGQRIELDRQMRQASDLPFRTMGQQAMIFRSSKRY